MLWEKRVHGIGELLTQIGAQRDLKISLNCFRALGVREVMHRVASQEGRGQFHVCRNHLGLLKMQILNLQGGPGLRSRVCEKLLADPTLSSSGWQGAQQGTDSWESLSLGNVLNLQKSTGNNISQYHLNFTDVSVIFVNFLKRHPPFSLLPHPPAEPASAPGVFIFHPW